MSAPYRTRQHGGTTWFVEFRGEWLGQGGGYLWHKVGTINAPGRLPGLPYHAIMQDESLQGHFAHRSEAVAFIVNHAQIAQEVPS